MMVYNLRNLRNVANRAQPSSDTDSYVPSSAAADFEKRIAGATATIDALAPLLDALKPSSDFETGIVNYLTLITAHLRELKTDHIKLREDFSFRNRAVTEHFDDLHLNVVKNEQYSRRDTVTVIGLAKPENETQADLCRKVADVFAQSGESVSASDLSVVHRNSKDSKTLRGKLTPPSITARFCRISKKDTVLKQYRNFDNVSKSARDVKIYQSLSPHYADLRGSIVDFFKLNSGDNKYGLSNSGVTLKWCTYQSPTAGFAVKLSDDTYFNMVHLWIDFANIFRSRYPQSCG